MKNNKEYKNNLYNKLNKLKCMVVMQIDEDTNSIGMSFEYIGVTYTVYFDIKTEHGDLLKHDIDNITKIENIGRTSADGLIKFFNSLPQIDDILS